MAAPKKTEAQKWNEKVEKLLKAAEKSGALSQLEEGLKVLEIGAELMNDAETSLHEGIEMYSQATRLGSILQEALHTVESELEEKE